MPAFKTIVVNVDDLAAAKALYATALGAEPHTDQPHYVGFNVDGCEFGLAPRQGPDLPAGVVPYLDSDDVEATLDALRQAGATVLQESTDVGGGTAIAIVADPEGNRFGIRSAR